MENVTIYSIAEKTGVAPSTVSRVLNNNPHVSPETRAKVLKACDELGFVPNDTARNLVNRSSNMIGVLVTDIRETQQSSVVHTIEQESMKFGYSCLIYNTGSDDERLKTYVRLLSQKKVDGVILVGSSYRCEQMYEYIKAYLSSVPIVSLNGVMEGENIYNVFYDMKSGVLSCLDLLRSKGRKRIGFVYGIERPSTAVIQKAAIEHQKYMGDFSFFSTSTPRRPEEIDQTISNIIKANPDVDGFIFSDDYLALGAIRGLLDLGIRVPEDVSVIGIGNTRFSMVSNPRLTTLDAMYFECALTAVRILLGVLKGDVTPREMVLRANLIERETT